jgi:hypothetical protein
MPRHREDGPIRLAARKREIREADLTPRGRQRRARIEDLAVHYDVPLDESDPWPKVRIGFTAIWGAAVAGYTTEGTCPGCGDARLRAWEVCVVCHQTRKAPRQWPMMSRETREKILRAPLRKRVGEARTRREKRARAG